MFCFVAEVIFSFSTFQGLWALWFEKRWIELFSIFVLNLMNEFPKWLQSFKFSPEDNNFCDTAEITSETSQHKLLSTEV